MEALHEAIDYGHCGNCGRHKYLQAVIFKDESGISEYSEYCEDCIKNNPHVRIVKK